MGLRVKYGGAGRPPLLPSLRGVGVAPAPPYTHTPTGSALEALQRPQEALDCYAQALQQAPAHPDALANITALLERLGQPQEAARYRQKAAQAGGPASG